MTSEETTNNHWDYGAAVPIRQERHFTDRVMPCFADRPSGPYEAFARAVVARSGYEALVVGDMRLTYSQLSERADRVAAGLAKRGVVVGDRVATLLENQVEFVTTFLAILRLGAIAVPMGTRLQGPEIAYIVSHSGAKVLVHDSLLASRTPSASEAPDLLVRIAVGKAVAGSESYEQVQSSGKPPAAQRIREEEVAVILYTSGTTGKPKGATLTNLNFVHSMLNYQLSMKMGREDRTLMAVPVTHVTGLVANMMMAWSAQCALIMMPEFKTSKFIELVARERITHTVMVPAIYNLCLLQPNLAGFDLSSWRVGGYGGAPMAESTIAALAEKLPSLGLFNVYGSTETCGPVTMLASELTASRPDSTGQVLPCAEVVVMDEGVEVPTGQSGELWIRGAMVVPGYWKNESATRDNFVAGFWRSGDIGSKDEQGFVRVFDRLKDMLNRGGFKIFSVEVENVLLEHPAVVETAIVGKPCPVLGERVHAYVSLKEGATASAEELKHFCSERLADYKVPESYTVSTAPLPRNANGKLLKKDLRARLFSMENTA